MPARHSSVGPAHGHVLAERDDSLLAPLDSRALHAGVAPPFAEVFRAHGGYVLTLLRRLGVNAADVEDVAQEVFVTVYAKLPEFEGRSALKTWLCGICLRKAASYRRKHRSRRELPGAPLPPLVASDDPQAGLAHKQHAALLHVALARLPDKQREVFVLYEIEELEMAEVARAVGCPRFTAYTRLRAARSEVRAFFTRHAARSER